MAGKIKSSIVVAWLCIFAITGFNINVVAQEKKPLWLVYFVGMSDGVKETDGIIFKIEIGEPGQKRTVAGKTEWADPEWKFCKVDLSSYRDKKVVIRFITDPNENTSYDWACWGEMKIVEGDLPKDYAGGNLPSGVKVLFDFTQLKSSCTGYISDGKDVTPINSPATGATFDLAGRTCGGVQKQGYFAHPGWKEDAAGCPAFGEFEIDMAKPAPVAVVVPTAPVPQKSVETKKVGDLELEIQDGTIEPRVKKVEYVGDNKFEITYEWAAKEIPEEEYRVFVHITSSEYGEKNREDIAFQNDHNPTVPVLDWMKNKPAEDGPFTVAIPEKCGPGVYYIRVGLFNQKGRFPGLKGPKDKSGRTILGKLILKGKPGEIDDVKFEKLDVK